MSGRDEMFDSILLRRDDVTPSQWPKLSCSQAHQTALENSDLRLDANREILFQGNGQLTASSDMLFLTGGSSPEKLRILTNGNVGIGISAPTEKLEVAGKIKAIELEASGTVKATAFQGDGSALTGKVNTTGDTITGSLTIQKTLTVSGNIGIGTTNPSYKLAIAAGDINIDDGRALRQAGRWVIGGNSNVLSIGSSDKSDSRDIRFDLGFAGALTIKNDTGNVGIGTTSPTAKLHIYSNDDNALKITNTTLSKAARMGVDSLGVWIEPSETNSSIRLNANPSLIGLYVRGTNGNVGIGTTNPAYKLDVAGDIQGSGRLSSQDGKVRRDFITWHTVENSSNPIHIKTNIPKKSNVMYRILVEGYNYGIAATINSDIVGYTYENSEKIISEQTNNYTDGVNISQYYSFDGYVVIKLTTHNTYCLGFSASAWFTNPPGNGFNISATVYHQPTNL